MKILIQKIMEAIERGESVVLCTVLASSGSAPRGAGARMAVFADGTALGTVGGGRVELLAARDAKEILKGGEDCVRDRLRAFDLTPNDVNSIGMVCGGKVSIYYQLVTEADMPTLCAIRDALKKDENSWLYLRARDGLVEKFTVVTEAEAKEQPELFQNRAVYCKGEPLVYTEPLVQAGQVYIFGGGHVGQALVPVLAGVGFRVTLFDNRPELANQERFPMANRVILGDYKHICDYVTLKPQDYVVIMSPGHQSDFALLEQVLRFPLRYVGCIGSRQKIARSQEMLRNAGIPEDVIQSVHSPIGLNIRAQTPAEIAISIAAEMILCRAESL